MNRVVVVGARSMLGGEVLRQLSEAGIEALSAGRDRGNDIVVDLGSGVMPTSDRQADTLFLLASAFGGNTETGRLDNIRTNVAGCAEVVALANAVGARKLLFAGTSFSYLTLSQETMAGYGFTKSIAEQVLQWHCDATGSSFCSLRFGPLWDTGGRCCAHQPWFGRIIAYASRGLAIAMPPSHGPRNYMHVSDAARLLIGAAQQQIKGVHAVCHPHDIDSFELAKAAYRIFGHEMRAFIAQEKTPFRKVEFPSDASFFESLNIRPTIELPDGLRLIQEAGTAGRFGPMDVL